MSKLLEKRAARWLPDEQERARFVAAMTAGDAARPAILWRDPRPEPSPFEVLAPQSWQPAFVDALAPGQRPGQHPLHESGALYCLDLSSVFEAAPLAQLPTEPQQVIDVCASPGGKSLLAWRTLSPQSLVSNETIGKRLGPLTGNLTRCRIPAVRVTSLDPARLAEQLPASAEVVLVDAPCSGQSLLARGMDNPGCFHDVTIGQNAGRQKRIIAESARLVAPGGWLLYTTCTFSREENEGIVRWLLERNPEFEAVEAPALAAHRSAWSDFPCYRLWPHEGAGAGGFTALLRRG